MLILYSSNTCEHVATGDIWTIDMYIYIYIYLLQNSNVLNLFIPIYI